MDGRKLKCLPEKVIQAAWAGYSKDDTYGGRKPYNWHVDALKRNARGRRGPKAIRSRSQVGPRHEPVR